MRGTHSHMHTCAQSHTHTCMPHPTYALFQGFSCHLHCFFNWIMDLLKPWRETYLSYREVALSHESVSLEQMSSNKFDQQSPPGAWWGEEHRHPKLQARRHPTWHVGQWLGRGAVTHRGFQLLRNTHPTFSPKDGEATVCKSSAKI